MNPYHAATGSVWMYNVERAREDDFEALADEEAVFIVLDGIVQSENPLDYGQRYRRAMSLVTGQSENFTIDSRLNKYSEPLL